jgi:hypothetical protein
MRRWVIPSAIFAGLACATLAAQPQRRDVDNVAAFARLYGVVRYFYPGDAAANLAWNRFAVHGVRLARTARDTGELEKTLTTLFAPLGPGIEIARALPPPPPTGIPDPSLISWRYAGAAMDPQTVMPTGPYRGKRTNRDLVLARMVGGITMAQTIPAAPLRGRTIRLRGLVRVTSGSGPGAVLWLRVDRPGQQMGFFDNMMDRPVSNPSWREYTIEGAVADDATDVAFGTIVLGAVSADVDGLTLSVREADGQWTPVAIQDGGFEGDAAAPGWSRGGNVGAADVTRPADQAPEGKQFLRIAAKETPSIKTEAFDADPPGLGAHVDIELGLGLKARVRLALTDAEAKAAHTAGMQALTSALESAGDPAAEPDLDARLADVAVAWNVFRHFYPYWTEAAVDWDARLRPHLEAASAAKDRDGQRQALRRLVADVRDGHGSVNDVRRRRVQMSLPIALEVREKRIVVTASNAPDQAPIGAIVTAIGGAPADRRLSDLMSLNSGTAQWRERRALAEMTTCQPGAAVTLALETAAGARSSSLACDARSAPAQKRPEPISELQPGVWYVDLTRARISQITPELPKLAAAKGVVFDLRGYPTDSGFAILPFLIAEPETDRWMHVAHFVGPFGKIAGWRDLGWDLKPQSPHVQGKVVFLTDGRAISYAESVMGYVGDRKLATIVGGATAGANGNVATFQTPSGFSIGFTGMKVTRHDGKSPFHLAGVAPDVPVAPTIEGLRAGRDEVLERGVAVILGK